MASESDMASTLAQNVLRLMAAQSPPWINAEFSRRSGIRPQHVTRLLLGTHPPNSATLVKVANAFGVTVCELLCSESKPKRK